MRVNTNTPSAISSPRGLGFEKRAILRYSLRTAPVVQWIGHQLAELTMSVRFWPGAHVNAGAKLFNLREWPNMNHHRINRYTKDFSIAVGIIIIWRGVWVLLDLFDKWMFGNNHVVTAVLGIIVGIIILYLPDHNLKTLERL